MKRGAANIAGLILLTASARLFSEERIETRVVIPSVRTNGITFPLPPNATVQRETRGGQQGMLPLSVQPAADHWEKRLVAEGWLLTGREALTGSGTGFHSTWLHVESGKEYHLLLMASSAGNTLYLWHFSQSDEESGQR